MVKQQHGPTGAPEADDEGLTPRRVSLRGLLWSQVLIEEHERGVLHRDGAVAAWLEPGRRRVWTLGSSARVDVVDLSDGCSLATPELLAAAPPAEVTEVALAPHEGGVVFVDGQPRRWIGPGRYLLWQQRAKVTLRCFNLNEPLLGSLDDATVAVIPSRLLRTATVSEHERALLIVDGAARAWLEPGRHVIWQRGARVEVRVLDVHSGCTPSSLEARALMPPGAGEPLMVAPHEAAFLIVDGQPTRWLEPDHYILWHLIKRVEVARYDMRDLHVDLPDALRALAPAGALLHETLSEHERGVLIVDGEVEAWIEPGRHAFWQRLRQPRVLRVDLRPGHTPWTPELERIAPEGAAVRVDISHQELALLTREGEPEAHLPSGRYLLWQLRERVGVERYPCDDVRAEVPPSRWRWVPPSVMSVHTLRPYERGVLYVDGALIGLLEVGRHAFFRLTREVEVRTVDLREQSLLIQGQEILTADKVSLRVNLLVAWRVVDPLRSVEASVELRDALYAEAQMAARRYIGGVSVDALLERRDDARAVMLSLLAARVSAWGVEVLQIDLKDIILPGEMKTLMARVIEAEKQAAASAIARREQVEAMRAQVNAARLIDRHPTLLRLREMDLLRDVAERIGHVTLTTHLPPALSRMLTGADDDASTRGHQGPCVDD